MVTAIALLLSLDTLNQLQNIIIIAHAASHVQSLGNNVPFFVSLH